ncbi:MAG: hypothetical protein D6704_07985 [Nitrospirae bacterium]|nr:MAG: hypothetical protein D6704_07985 [Nitrospirota bacterium]
MYATVSVVVALMLAMAGCVVTKSKYEQSVAELEATKVELEKSRMLRNALEEQNRKLKSEIDKLSADLRTMTSEVQRIKESRESERSMLESREAELEKQRQALRSKLELLGRELQKAKSQNRALRETIRRYQQELKAARVQAARPVPKGGPPRRSETAKIAPKTKTDGHRTEASPVVTPGKSALTPVNINTASVNDLVLFLGLTKEVAEKVVAHRPYRLRGELVAKKVIPKATFDVIKDRITAAPPPKP